MRSFVFATAFLALMLVAAVCPPATQAAPAKLTVNFEIVNPADFWATPISNTTFNKKGPLGRERIYEPARIIDFKIGTMSLSLNPNTNKGTIPVSSEAGSEIEIKSVFYGSKYSSEFFNTGTFKVVNNGQTVTIRLSVPHVTSSTKPTADVTMTLVQIQ